MIRLFRRRAVYGPAVHTCSRPPLLRAEPLEDRCTPATTGAFVANGFGGGSFAPFDDPAVEVRSTSADVNGDGIADIITAAGAGGGSEIRIFDGRAARFSSQAVLISDFYAYSNAPGAGQAPGYNGGVFVAAADFNGDGFAEVVTSPGAGASGHLKVFDFNSGGRFAGNSPALRASFFAYPGFLGEIRVTTLTPGVGQSPLLVTASGAGTTQSDVRLYANAYAIGQVGAGTLVNPVSQTFPFPGYLGGVSVAGGSNGQLFVSPNTGASLVSAFNLSSANGFGTGGFGTGGFGATTLTPGATFQTGFNSPTDVRLGSADINGDGILDVLTSSVGATSATPISAFSGTNGFTSLNGLTGFQGFGFFGNSFVGSSAFTGVFPTSTTTGTTLGGAGFGGSGVSGSQGLGGFGSTQGLQSGGFLGTAAAPIVPSFTATNSTGFFNFVSPGAPTGTGINGTASQLNNGTLSPGVTVF